MMVGNQYRYEVTFTDLSGVRRDPTTIALLVRDPNATEALYVYGLDAQIVRDGVGVYHFDHLPTVPGDWAIRWTSTGIFARVERQLFVDASFSSTP